MPIFVHILFWGFAVLTIIGYIIYLFYAWIEGFVDGDYQRWIRRVTEPDPTNASAKPNLFNRHADAFGFVLSVAVTFGFIAWVGLMFQFASWIYDWGL